MALETAAPRSRRALLAAAAGGAAALVASALGRPAPTRAANGDAVTVGGSFSGTAATSLTATTAQPAFVGYSTATSGTSDGVRGEGYAWQGIGVYGIARSMEDGATGTGVRGDSLSPVGTGVYGSAPNTGVSGYSYGTYGRGIRGYVYSTSAGQPVGVDGSTAHATGIGVLGRGDGGGTGVLGISGPTSIPATPAKVGVFGYAIQDSAARGVYGRSNAGRGVYGQATSGSGVFGYATTGYALRASGRVKFDTASGTATIALGTKSKTVTPGFDLTSTTKVLATLMGNPGGTTAVQRVAVNTTANTFTMYLTANATANVKVAWLVLS